MPDGVWNWIDWPEERPGGTWTPMRVVICVAAAVALALAVLLLLLPLLVR
jgi:hypothetical protein